MQRALPRLASIQLAARHSQTLRLPDNRILSFAEHGSPNGAPFLFMHGSPDSRLTLGAHDSMLKRLGIRMITPDRPGMGMSTHDPKRRILDYPADVKALVDHLDLKKYSIFGWSGGCPYVIACAHKLPREELRSVGVVAGSGPIEAGEEGLPLMGKLVWRYIFPHPSIGRLVWHWSLERHALDPDPEVLEKSLRQSFKRLSEREYGILEPSMPHIVEAFREVFRQGSEGAALDLALAARPWGFDLADVDRPGIRIYCGTADVNTPIAQSRYMHKHLKGSILKELPGESHYTIDTDEAFEGMLKELLEDAGVTPEPATDAHLNPGCEV